MVYTSPGSAMASVIINDGEPLATDRELFETYSSAATWARGIAYSRDASVALIPKSTRDVKDYYTPLLVDSAAAAADWSRPDKGRVFAKKLRSPRMAHPAGFIRHSSLR